MYTIIPLDLGITNGPLPSSFVVDSIRCHYSQKDRLRNRYSCRGALMTGCPVASCVTEALGCYAVMPRLEALYGRMSSRIVINFMEGWNMCKQ